MKYKVISYKDTMLDYMEKDVERHLKSGWNLAGGVSVAHSGRDGQIIFAQALIKNETETSSVD